MDLDGKKNQAYLDGWYLWSMYYMMQILDLVRKTMVKQLRVG